MMNLPSIEALDYALAEKSLEDFIELGWRYIDPADFVPNWHIGAIAEHLEAVALGQIRRLAIMMPPRHMKSLSVSVAFPAWIWAQKKRSPLTGPGIGFLSTSYAQSLSVRDNLKCRRLIESPWYRRGWGDRFALTTDQNTKIRFENDKGGYRIASSVDGTATGDGGDIIMIDDPISAREALSPTVRAAANEWFDNTMSTRLNDPKTGAYIAIMQRLHEMDLIGHILERAEQEGGEEWTVLCLPARYEPDHPHVYAGDPRKLPGELLWKERMGEPQLKALEIRLGAYGAAGQLQQRPAPRSGGMFERSWFEIVDAAPAQLDLCRAWDFAASVPEPGRDPDFTAKVKIGRCPDGFFWILDAEKFQRSAHEVQKALENTASQDGKICRIRIPEDPGQAGKAQAQQLIRKLAGYSARAVRPTGNKETRATPLSAQAEAGNVKLVRGAWNEAFLDELSMFPFGKHDDQVDAAADAFNELADPADSSGFLSMIRQDNAAASEKAAEDQPPVANDQSACPYPKGSLEYLQFHGLVPS